jgi:hypothetical protein
LASRELSFGTNNISTFKLQADKCFALQARQKTCRNGSNDELSLAKEHFEDYVEESLLKLITEGKGLLDEK